MLQLKILHVQLENIPYAPTKEPHALHRSHIPCLKDPDAATKDPACHIGRSCMPKL